MTLLEIEPIENIDLEGTPPCEILIWWSRCGKPSAFRIRGTCPVHGSGVAFMCAACRQRISVRPLLHTHCDIPVEVRDI